MKTTITIQTSKDLKAFKRDFGELADFVKRSDDTYIMHLETHKPKNRFNQPMFLTKAQFNAALSPAMQSGAPSAFSPHIAGGGFLPQRLDKAYFDYCRAQARAEIMDNVPNSAVITNKRDYLRIYGERFEVYPPGRFGNFFNIATTASLNRNS